MQIVTLASVDHFSRGDIDAATALLTPLEYRRLGSFKRTRDAQLFLFGRYLARKLISHYAQVSPQSAKIRIDHRSGKPSLPHNKPYEFSISHSGNRVAVALSDVGSIGTDVQAHEQGSWEECAQFLTDREKSFIDQSHSALKFYRTWTAIESLAKITGLGLTETLANRTFSHSQASITYRLNRARYVVVMLHQDQEISLSVATTKMVTWKPGALPSVGIPSESRIWVAVEEEARMAAKPTDARSLVWKG